LLCSGGGLDGPRERSRRICRADARREWQRADDVADRAEEHDQNALRIDPHRRARNPLAVGRELEGDFVECGVYRGAMARMILHYIDFQLLPQKRFYLLDTFNGVPLESLTEEEISLRRPADFEESYERVKETFSAFENVTVVRGAIPGTLTEVKSDKVAFLSLDMNAAAPEIAAAEYFWPKLVSGAVMLLDDYGWPNHDVQRREFDRFAARHGVTVLPAPTGQGLIFKP